MSESRLATLEVKCAYLEKTVSELSEVLWRQQKELDALRGDYEDLKQRMNADPGLVDATSDERPPHY